MTYRHKQAQEKLGIPKLTRNNLNDYNEIQQITETSNLQQSIGDVDMIRFLLQKDSLLKNDIKIRRLREIGKAIDG